MVATAKVPRGCFGVPWNGQLLIIDPEASVTPGCRVLVHLRDDLRVRLVGTCLQESIEHGTIRVCIDHGAEGATNQDFDRGVVEVLKVVSVERISAQSGARP